MKPKKRCKGIISREAIARRKKLGIAGKRCSLTASFGDYCIHHKNQEK